MRRLFAVVALASLSALGLSGCSPAGAACIANEGTASKAVTVTGDFDTKPVVTFDKGLSTDKTERSVAIQGNGDQIVSGSTVKMEYTLYNATSGTLIETSAYTKGQEVSFPVDEKATQFVGLSKMLVCSTVGSRVVGVIPNADAFGAQAAAAGLGEKDVLLFVIDIIDATPAPTPVPTVAPLSEPKGKTVAPKAGFPTVTFDNGNPTITLPGGDIPTEYALETLIQGEGATVQDGNTVVVNYEGLNWNTNEVFDSSFDRGSTAAFPTNQVIKGFGQALVGQKVGSRVLVIIPPDLGYGEAGSGEKIGPNATLVFLVDILGIG